MLIFYKNEPAKVSLPYLMEGIRRIKSSGSHIYCGLLSLPKLLHHWVTNTITLS